MAETIKGINIVISGETTGLQKALADVNKQSKNLQSELKQTEKLLKLDPKDTTLLAQKQKLLTEAVAKTSEKLKSLKDAQQQVNEQFKAGKISEAQYRAFQRELVKTEGELKRLQTELKNTQSKVLNLSKTLAGVGEKFKNVGATMTQYVTLPIIAAGAATFVAAEKIDDAMDTIRLGTGATGKSLDALGEDFKAVFKTVPQGSDQVSTAIANLNTRTGLTGKALQDLANQTLTLARLTGKDVDPLIADTTRIFGDWSIATKDQSETLDYLWKVSQNTGIGVDALSQKVVQFGAPLRQMGFDFETSAAMIGKWEKEGVNAELVLGSLRMGLVRFSKAGEEPVAAMQRAIKEIKGMGSTAQANMKAVEIFGARAGPDMAAAIREGRFDLETLLETLKKSPETIEKAAKETDGFAEKIGILRNNATLTLAPLGDVLLRLFEEAAPTIERFLGTMTRLSESFAKLPAPVKTMAVTIAGLVAIIGPVVFAAGTLATSFGTLITGIGKVIPAINAMRLAMASLNVTMLLNPIALIITAVIALAAAVYLIIRNWSTVKAFFINLWNVIKTTVVNAGNAIVGFLKTWGPIILTVITGPIGTVVSAIAGHWETIKTGVATAWAKIRSIAATAVGAVVTTIETIIGKVKNIATDMFAYGKNIVLGLVKGMKAVVGKVVETATNIATSVKNTVKNILHIKSPSGLMVEYGRLVVEGLAEGMTNNVSKVKEAAQKMTDAIKGAADTMLTKLDLSLSITEKKFKLYELQMGKTANAMDKFRMKKDLLTAQFSTTQDQVTILTEAYNRLAKAQGAGSTDAMEIQSKLLDMQIKAAELRNELSGLSTQERRTRENIKLLETAAATAAGGGKSVVNNITVNNPKQETAGDTIRKELLRLQYLGAF